MHFPEDEDKRHEAFANCPGSLEGRLLLAVPKKGRLLQATLNLLDGADIKFRRQSRLDIALVQNLPVALVFLPAADIPTFVSEGRVSLGITGRDTVGEHAAGVEAEWLERAESGISNPIEHPNAFGCEEVMDLDFGACKLQIQIPQKGQYQKPSDLIGKNIATSFVHLAEKYFANLERQHNPLNAVLKDTNTALRTNIIELSGSVEVACALGVADGILDLVESGETMRAAGLRAIETVVSSTAVLIKSKSPTNPAMVDLITSRIVGVIAAQRHLLCQYNVTRFSLEAATKITPGKWAPTITPFEKDGWVAVSSMVEKEKVATAMDDLAALGATNILVLAIANTRSG